MKKSDIERQLKKDLSASAPSDFNAVWNKCTTPASEEREIVSELATAGASDSGAKQTSTRKAVSIVSVACALLAILAVVLCLTLLGKPDGDFVLPSHSGYFTIDVNPSIQVNYDSNGVVTSAIGLNQDGEALLGEIRLGGLTYDKAADVIFDSFVSHGYISAERDDNAILMTASNADGVKDEKMTAEINKMFAQKFENKNMKGAVISDVDNSKWQKDAEKYGINGQKYALIMRYIDLGGALDESEYETLSISDLYTRISELDKNKDDKK